MYAAIKTIAKGRNMTLSATAADMLAELVNTPEYQQEYAEAAETYGAVPPEKDTRIRPRGQRRFVMDQIEEKQQAQKDELKAAARTTYSEMVDKLEADKLEKLSKLIELLG